ncbi:Fungal Zn(2)-Cys(6) binuclear cluster domain [Ceratobasidium sp. AG-Ba]|nr:Fungal Zn(2)-Cys(6) binuclear cluster domain [Ceratobasidium sp. AG-Ba]
MAECPGSSRKAVRAGCKEPAAGRRPALLPLPLSHAVRLNAYRTMAAPTTTTTHPAPPSTSPAPASAGAQYPTPSSLPLDPAAFPPPPAYPTFVHNGVPYVYIPVPVAFLPGQPHATARKRKRPTTPPPCMLCRLSRTQCVATRPGEACQRCMHKQVDCFDDGDTAESSRLRHPPSEDGPDDGDSEPERDPNQSSMWQLPNGYSPQASYLAASATPGKRERVIKACADCHARKRKCTGIGGPNCGTAGPRGVPPAPNGISPAGSVRPSPRKGTPGGASGHTRMREPCADCRGRKRRCVHHGDIDKDAAGTDVDAGDESMRTDHEGDVHPRSHSPHSPPRWPPHPPNSYHQPPPPQPFSGYPYDHRMPYPPHPAGGPGQLVHHEHQYGPPQHAHGLHPHQRLPPAPNMRHPASVPSCQDCRARGIVCNCPETRADDGSSPNSTAPVPPAAPAKGATPAPAPPAGRKGRACLACRKLKMRCVAPNNGNENGNSNPDGPDERCQRCERAGLECIYVDRKRRGPGAVFGVQVDGANTPAPGSFDGAFTNGQTQNPPTQNGTNPNSNQNTGPNVNGVLGAPNSPSQRPPAKKLKREGSPRNSSPYNGAAGQMMHGGEDAARTLEDSLGDDDEEDRSSR